MNPADGDTVSKPEMAMNTGNLSGRVMAHPVTVGRSCHQCKNAKSLNILVFCANLFDKRARPGKRRCRKKYCTPCLKKFYPEATQKLILQTGICASCRGICSCAACFRKRHALKYKNAGGRKRAAMPASNFPTPDFSSTQQPMVRRKIGQKRKRRVRNVQQLQQQLEGLQTQLQSQIEQFIASNNMEAPNNDQSTSSSSQSSTSSSSQPSTSTSTATSSSGAPADVPAHLNLPRLDLPTTTMTPMGMPYMSGTPGSGGPGSLSSPVGSPGPSTPGSAGSGGGDNFESLQKKTLMLQNQLLQSMNTQSSMLGFSSQPVPQNSAQISGQQSLNSLMSNMPSISGSPGETATHLRQLQLQVQLLQLQQLQQLKQLQQLQEAQDEQDQKRLQQQQAPPSTWQPLQSHLTAQSNISYPQQQPKQKPTQSQQQQQHLALEQQLQQLRDQQKRLQQQFDNVSPNTQPSFNMRNTAQIKPENSTPMASTSAAASTQEVWAQQARLRNELQQMEAKHQALSSNGSVSQNTSGFHA